MHNLLNKLSHNHKFNNNKIIAQMNKPCLLAYLNLQIIFSA